MKVQPDKLNELNALLDQAQLAGAKAKAAAAAFEVAVKQALADAGVSLSANINLSTGEITKGQPVDPNGEAVKPGPGCQPSAP